jgi:mannose-6-phosphate isomerase-like protein (cupin superfamily)
MTLPSSSIRGFFEILMPGIFLVLNAALTAYFLGAVLSPGLQAALQPLWNLITNPAVAIFLLVAVGYPVGVVLRLLKSARIDALSARYIRFLKPKTRNELYLTDHFFYGNWMYDKAHTRLPAEAARFYDDYWKDKYTGDGTTNTTWFNFCKTIIAKNDIQSGLEIYAAEALSRFLAGSYYALQVSIVLMLANAVVAGLLLAPGAAILPALVALAYLFMFHIILSQYRLLRHKEVDTVFSACFANRKAFDELFPNLASRQLAASSGSAEADARRDLILRAWQQRWTETGLSQSLSLENLVGLMRRESQLQPYLSSLYFAGADVDHPFFLENDRLALGISVLPQDAEKASQVKQHPHQTEVLFVLQGSLELHYGSPPDFSLRLLSADEHFVISPGVCHWITPAGSGEAVYLFVKTNAAQEPRSQPCSYS